MRVPQRKNLLAARDCLSSVEAAHHFQYRHLTGVSRSFALTIPRLPPALSLAVGNAYLLCRMADIIEDDPAIGYADTCLLFDQLLGVIETGSGAEAFARESQALLGPATGPAERRLMGDAAQVFAVYAALPPFERETVADCVRSMCLGMRHFCATSSLGLPDQLALDRYCYSVAGVVGQMLTALFCHHAEDIAERRDELQALSVSFGQGLQLTNILKDVWADLARSSCWLPRDLLDEAGVDFRRLTASKPCASFLTCQSHLVGLAHGHLHNALDYTLLIPPRHRGIRVFCLWAVALALPTLQHVQLVVGKHGQTRRISKVQAVLITQTIAATAGSNTVQRALFRRLGQGLPWQSVDLASLPQDLSWLQTPSPIRQARVT